MSNGKGQHLFVGRNGSGSARRALIAFDLSAVPAGVQITGVELVLRVSRAQQSPPTQVRLHRLTADWGEGASIASGNEGGGAVAAQGDASWHFSKFNTRFWNALGGDFVSTASASAAVGSEGRVTWGSTAQMLAHVQGWLSNPGSNFGWVLIGDESKGATAKRFDSRDNLDADSRPVLIVTYLP